MATEKQRKLYDALSEDYDMGTFEQFCSDIKDETKRRKLYDATIDEYDYGSWENFSKDLGFGPKYFRLRRGGKDFTVSADEVNAAGGLAGWAKANPGAPLRVYMQGKREDGGDFEGHVDLSVAHDRSKQRGYKYSLTNKPIEDKPQKPWHPTEQQKIAMSHQLHHMQAQSDAMFKESRERTKNLSDYYSNSGALGFKTVEGKPEINPETGKMEKTYLAPTGDRTTNKAIADKATSDYRQALGKADMTIGGQLRRAYAERSELDRKANERLKAITDGESSSVMGSILSSGDSMMGAMSSATSPNTQRVLEDTEYQQYRQAIREIDQRIQTLENRKFVENGGDHGFWRSFGQTITNPEIWGGMTTDFLSANAKMQANHSNTESAQSLKKNIAENEFVQNEYGDFGFWSRTGVMTGEMLPFMLDFSMTGAGFEAMNMAGKAATRMATKAVGKKAVEEMAKMGVKAYAKKYGAKGVGRMAGNWVIKALGTTADDLLIRAPLMTNTVQVGKTAADIIDRKLGDVTVDENGNYDFSNDKTWGSAIWQGEANAIIENYSEMFGTHLGGVEKTIAKVFGGKRISGMLARANASSFGKILDTTRQQFQRLGVSDYFGEVCEEYYGQLWRSMLNLDDAYTNVPVLDENGNQVLDADGKPVYERKNLLFTGQFHGDIWGGMALSMGLMGAGKYGLSGAAYGSMKHQVSKADKRAAEIFTPERWEPIRELVDNTTNEDMGVLAENMVNDQNLSDGERSAVMEYMERSLNFRGMNLGSIAQSRGAEGTEETGPTQGETMAHEAREAGYNMTEPEQRERAMRDIRYRRSRVAEVLGRENIDEMLEEELGTSDPAEVLDLLGESRFDANERTVIADYIKARETGDSVMRRMEDDSRAAIEKENTFIDKVSHEDGYVRPATMKAEGRQVYIVKGNVELSEDGTVINTATSDDVIYIYDPATDKVEQTSTSQLAGLGTATTVEESRSEVERTIREKQELDTWEMQGNIAFRAGDEYMADVSGDGPEHIQIVGLAEDGKVIYTTADGKQRPAVDAGRLSSIIDRYKQNVYEAEMRQQPSAAADNIGEGRSLVRTGDESGPVEAEPAATKEKTPVDIRYNPNDSFRVSIAGRSETQQSAVLDREGDKVTIWTPFAVTDNSEKAETMTGYLTDLSRAELDAIIERDDHGNAVGYVSGETSVETPTKADGQEQNTEAQTAAKADEAEQKSQGPEETVIREGISGTADALKESFAVERERIGNEWLDNQAVQDAMRTYAEGASSVEEIVERAKADSNDERTRQRLDTLLEFDSTRQKLKGLLGGSQTEVTAAEADAPKQKEGAVEATESVDIANKPDVADGTALSRIPVDEQGQPKYEEADPGTAWDAIVEQAQGDEVIAAEVVADIVADRQEDFNAADKALTKIKEGKPEKRKKGEAAPTIAERIAAKNAAKTALAEAQKIRDKAKAALDRWKEIAGTTQRRKAELHAAEIAEQEAEERRKASLDKRLRETFEEVKDVPEAVEVLENMDPRDIHEVAASLLSVRKVLWSDKGVKVGVKSETGFGEGERRRLFGLFASAEKGGMSLSRLAEDEMKQECETYGIPYDNQEARNALIDVISGARTVSDIRNYIADRRIDDAQTLASAARRHEEELYDRWCQEELHMSAQDVEMYEEVVMAELAERDREFDENEYYGYIADEMARQANNQLTENGKQESAARRGSPSGDRGIQSNDAPGESEISGRGNEILSESRTNQTGGVQTDGQRPGIQPTDGLQGDGTPTAVAEKASGRVGGTAVEPSGYGDFGPIFTQFKGDTKGAVRKLIELKTGEAIGALHHRDIGDIDLVWGKAGTGKSDGFGLAKLVQFHPEVVEHLQEIIDDMHIVKRSVNRINLESETHKAAVRLTWNKEKKKWLLTAFEKKETSESIGKTTDTDENPSDLRGDTALSQNSDVSGDKGNTLSSEKQEDSGNSSLGDRIKAAEAEVDTNPSEAQKEAGNYKMGHVKVDGLDISIENPKGSKRSGKDPDGTPWETEMKNTYGYIKGTTGVDGDKIDVFLSDSPSYGDVYVVDQYNKDGSFDEHKVMYGFTSATEAEAAYLSNYSADWAKGRKVVVTGVTREEFKKWLDASDRKRKPFAEYKSVKAIPEAEASRQGRKEVGYELDVYETKRGKKFHRVKFPRADKEVWKERLDIAKEQFGGTSVSGGYGFKDAETAKAFAEAILYPFSAEGLKKQTDAMTGGQSAAKANGPEQKNEEPRGVAEAEKKTRSKWFNDEDQDEAADIIRKMKARLRGGNLYGGIPINVELLELGCRLGYLIMKKGASKLHEYAQAMIENVGDGIRPYIKQFYNATLATEEALNSEWYKGATPMAEIAKFDVVNFLKDKKGGVVETARGMVEEQDVKAAMPKAATDMVKTRRNSDGSVSETFVSGDKEITRSTGIFIPGVSRVNGKTQWVGPTENKKPAQELPSLFDEPVSQAPVPQRPKGELSGDSANEQDRRAVEHDFVEAVSNELIQRINNEGSPLTMAEVRKMAEARGMKDVSPTDLQELVERAVSLRARSIAEHTLSGGPGTQEIGFNKVVKLYTTQPVLSDRDVERIQRQQYSTPVPMGYLMDQFMMSHGHKGKRLLEPSAGNGALTIGVPKDYCHVNDIDPRRLANLRAMGFKVITNQDALQPFEGQYDMVVTNPPFDTAPVPRTYDGLFEITTLEGQMAINALDSMTDDGRAAIIVGGSIGKWPTPYEKNGRLQKIADRQFFGYLYSHYNVVDIIPIDGKSLYSRNGTGYNVRMILIDGRRRDAEGNVIREVNAENRVFPPVKEEGRPEAVTTYDELYKRVQDDILRIQQRLDVAARNDGGHIEGDGAVSPSDAPMANPAGDRGGERPVGTGDSSRTPRSGLGGDATDSTRAQGGIHGRSGRDRGVSGQTDADAGSGDGSAVDARSGSGGRQTELRAVEHVDRPGDRGGVRHGATDTDGGTQRHNPDGARQRGGSGPERLNQPEPVKVELTDEKVASPHVSSSNQLQSRMPAAQALEFKRALHSIEEKHGNVDEWLTQELGYADTADLYRALAAEQIEGVAMAIDKMNSGRGFIIADQTGIGKGRQAASIIRYATRNGHKPIFFTQKAGLFSDMYRDLKDIGCPDLKPFIFGSDKDEASITERQDDGTDKVIYPLPKPKERERVLSYIEKHGTLPDEYDYAVITYSQVQNGTTLYEIGDNGKIEAKTKTKKGKGSSSGEINGERRRHVIDLLSRGNYLILDEAHTAGGQSGLGGYMQSLIPGVKGITYLSATYAKRPDNMPLYAIKTAISDSGVEVAELINAVAQGGVPLQEIMSRQLVKSGEMARRERDFTGVSIDWIPTDEGVAREQQKRFDTVSEIFVDIMRFQDTYVQPYLNEMSKDLARVGSSSGQKKGTKDMGIGNAPFASKLYNLLQQLLFSIKVDAVADRAIKNLQNGRKPIISFVNTMEGFLEEASIGMTEDGSASMPTLSLALRKALDGVMRYTVKDDNNNETHSALSASQLGPDAETAYNAIIEKMNAVSDDLPIAPLDAIRLKIEAAGYKVGELSGRKLELAKNDKGLYVIRNRKAADKKATASDFNAGKIDVLMVNKTGSTGISLHASSKFEDQRQRVMIAAQFQPDVNDEVQMRGRNDRTGQVVRGAYEYLLSSIPAEQRLQMMFKAKLKSLDANTTSSQKSSFNEMEVVDVLNKYGDAIVWEYLNEDPMGLNMDMGNPLGIDPSADVEKQQQETAKKSRNNKDDEDGSHSGFARKALGRLALLSIAEQERVMSEITERYEKKIHELNERGENDLEISYRDLKAKTLGRKVWVEGKAPNSGNAFADNVYMEQVEVNILDKPLSGKELTKFHHTFLDETGVETWDEWIDKKTAEIDSFYENRIATVRERIITNKEATIARRVERFISTAKDARTLGKNSFTDEEITAEANRRYGEAERQEAQVEIERETEKIRVQQNLIKSRVSRFKPMTPLAIPDDLTDESKMNLEPSTGVMVGIKLDSKYSLNGSSVVFAPLDGRRTITLSLKEAGVAFSKIGQASLMIHDVLRNFDLGQWDSHISNDSRETRYMLTGNILRALVDMQKTQNARGRITAYTTEDGEVRTGILMSPKFTPGDLQSSASLSAMKSRIESGEEVKSSNGEVTVRKTRRWTPRGDYEVLVPKSKQYGGKYYMPEQDPVLARYVVGGFEMPRSGNQAIGYIRGENLARVLDHLSTKHGARVMVSSKLKEAPQDGIEYRTAEEGVEYVNARVIQPWSAPLDRLRFKRDELGESLSSSERQQVRDLAAQEKVWEETWTAGHTDTDVPTGRRSRFDFYAEQYGQGGMTADLNHAQREAGPLRDAGGRFISANARDMARRAIPILMRRRADLLADRPSYSRAGQAAIDAELADLEYMALYYQRMEAGEDVERTMPGRLEHQRMLATAREVAEALGEKVVLYEAPGDILDKNYNRQVMKQRSYGWYNPNDGTIHINVGRHQNAQEIVKTALHEIIGHKTIEQIMGPKRFARLIDEIWDHAGRKVRAKIAEKMHRNNWDFREATKEYLGEIAEEVHTKGFDKLEAEKKTIWQRLKAKIQDFLNRILEGLKIPARIRLSEEDLSYMMWKLYKHKERKAAGEPAEGDIFDKAEEIVRREQWERDGKSLEIAARYGESDETSIENLAHGVDSLRKIALGADEVKDAMHRNDLSKYSASTGITFVFGKPGDATKNYRGGFGLSHIGAKHGADTILKVLDAIASGKISRYVEGNKTVVIEKDGYEALLALTRFGKNETWLFNGWDKIETTDENGKVSASTVSTQANPTFSREDLGAVVSDAKLREFFESAKQTSDNLSDYLRSEYDNADMEYRVRRKPAPRNTIKVYKLVRVKEDRPGEWFPLFIDSAAPLRLGEWLDADSPDLEMLRDREPGQYLVNPQTKEVLTREEVYQKHPELRSMSRGRDTKYPSVDAINYATDNGLRWMEVEETDKAQRRFNGENRRYWNLGINGSGSVSTFSMRPGWHAGSLPTMRQIGKGKNKDLRDDNFVWVEGEVSADVDYQAEADRNPDKDLPDRIPEDGFYMKATNANKATSQANRVGWYVAGSFKANRFISDAEARQIIDDFNAAHPDMTPVAYDYERESGRTYDPEEGLHFRDGDDMAGMTIEEKTLKLSVMLADRHSEDVAIRDAAVEALGKKLGNIRKAMATQHSYDFSTVRNLGAVADILISSGTFLPEGPAEVKRLYGIMKRGIGHAYTDKKGVEHVAQSDKALEKDFNNAVESLMDLFVSNQLKLSGKFLDEVMKIRGSKVNARGVEVMGELDVEGQMMVRSMKSYMGMNFQAIHDRIDTLDDIIANGNDAASMNAAAEKMGLELAEQYVNEVSDRLAQEKIMRDQLRDMSSQWDATLSGDARKAYKEQKRALRESIRKIRIERADALRQLASQVGNELRNSIERVKAFREREKQRIEEIWHNANSDMTGRAFDEHGMKKKGLGVKLSNNMVSRLLFAPAATFEQVMRVFGSKSVDGEGYLFDRYVRGWQECRDKEWTSTQEVEGILNDKAAEILGKRNARWSDLYALTRKEAGSCDWWDGGEIREHKVTQGNLMYMYMVNKMTDGQVKLRRMCITDDKMLEIEQALDPRLKAVADWLQEELLPNLRNRYNEVHIRMFGAPMAEIDNYFPLKILANARLEEVEMAGKIDGKELPKTMTGAIIKRRYNNYALDVLNSDAVSVALDHIREMETWAAFAEYRRDLCTLLSYKHFRNQVKNMSTIYGSGEKFWDKFYDLALLVGGAYQPKTSEFDKVAVNITKLATGACIAIRLNTALKQLLSYPAFAPDVNMTRLMYNVTPWRMRACWKWAMENMPSFQRRWKSRQAGNDLLRAWKFDWDWTRTDFVQKVQRAGITPNAFIDALTVAMGSEAVYHSKLKGYLKDGFSKEESHRRAIQDAEIIFNLSQQSSELPYLSLLQNDRSYLTTCITNFRNSPMSYLRQSIQSKRELANMVKSKVIQIEFETKKAMREGLTPEQAKARAERKFKRNWVRNLFKSTTFDYILPALWTFGLSGIWYCIFGDDDDKKKQYADDSIKRGMLGGLEGFTFGGTVPDFIYGLATGEKPQLDEETSPAMGLITEVVNLYSNGKTERAANEMINTMIALGTGVNPQVLEDGVVAGMDFFGQDEKSARDWALLFMRVIQVPQSQMDQVYFDELGMDAREAQRMSPAQLAERYATYKARRSNFATVWAMNDSALAETKEPWLKRFNNEAKERLKGQSEDRINESLEVYDAEYSETGKRLTALKQQPGDVFTKAERAKAFFETPEGIRYQLYKGLHSNLDKMIKSWLEAPTPQEAATEAATIIEYKAKVVKMLDSWANPGVSRQAGREAMTIANEWSKRQNQQAVSQ